jgi:signal transduction histidine kinase
VTVETTGDLTDLPAAVEVAAYRILTEAVNNASRHSGARRCWLRVERAHALRIRVEDDGCGIPMPPPTTGQGLASIAARAAELGGSAIVERRDPAGGSLVSVSLPLESSGADDDA